MAIRRMEIFVSDELPDHRVTALIDTKGKEPTVYKGSAIATRGQQAVKIDFPIEAENLTEAFKKYKDAAQKAAAEMNRPKIAVPGPNGGRIRMD